MAEAVAAASAAAEADAPELTSPEGASGFVMTSGTTEEGGDVCISQGGRHELASQTEAEEEVEEAGGRGVPPDVGIDALCMLHETLRRHAWSPPFVEAWDVWALSRGGGGSGMH